MVETKHLSKPIILKLLKLCSETKFRKRIKQLRARWQISELAKSIDEANQFWQSICQSDRGKRGYHDRWYDGKTADRKLKEELEKICQDPDVDLPLEMWVTVYYILLCINLDDISEERLIELPAHPSLLRISFSPSYLNPIQDYHLYVDVTFASTQDVREVWQDIRYWQENIRPKYIEEGLLPDLLKDIKNGRPYGINESRALEVAKLKYDKGWTWAKIGKKFNWPLQEDSYGNLNQCSTARYYAKRGLELRKRKGITNTN
jgi:hypothetical protein